MTTAQDMLAYYRKRIDDGQVESPLGSNHCDIDGCPCEIGGMVGNMKHYAWCARGFNNGRRAVGLTPVETASCWFNIKAYQDGSAGAWLGHAALDQVMPGDQVFFGKAGSDHTGIIVQPDGVNTRALTYEFNISDRAAARWRPWFGGDLLVYGIGRPVYSNVSTPPPAPVPPQPHPAPPAAVPAPPFPLPPGFYFGPKEGPNQSVSGYFSHRSDLRAWQERMQVRGWVISTDGLYGPETARITKLFQADKRLIVDGQIGPVTWAAAWNTVVT